MRETFKKREEKVTDKNEKRKEKVKNRE